MALASRPVERGVDCDARNGWARRGWAEKTFCGAATDFSAPLSVDDILTSSGGAVGERVDGADMRKIAKKSGAKTVAWLHRLAYRDII